MVIVRKMLLPANKLGITSFFVNYGYGKIDESVKAKVHTSNILELKKFF